MESGIKLPNRLLKKEEVMEYLGVQSTTITKYIQSGLLSPVKNIGEYRFTPNEIARFIGADVASLSPIVFKNMEKEINEKKREIESLRNELLYKNNLLQKICKMIGDEKTV